MTAKALMPDPGLNACTCFNPETVTWAFGAHAAVVEVDTESCGVRLLDYAVLHDYGQPINPMVVHGQLQGGAMQGIRGALAPWGVVIDALPVTPAWLFARLQCVSKTV